MGVAVGVAVGVGVLVLFVMDHIPAKLAKSSRPTQHVGGNNLTA